ncbi:MAG: endoglucanase [Gammaproteobacteria bacterium]|nr:MAG: endoglucanase [Gammaproteobacteria bacterium]
MHIPQFLSAVADIVLPKKSFKSLSRTCSLLGAFAIASAFSASAFASCQYVVTNEWNSGFTGAIRVTNNTSAAVTGWNVSWKYNAGDVLTSSWNATVTGNNPYAATNISWNGAVPVGQTVEFGIQGNKGGSTAEIPAVTGSLCGGTVTSSSGAATSSSKSSVASVVSSASSKSSVASVASSSVKSSSVASSAISSVIASGEQCNWYGTLYPLCTTTTSGWGYENNKSCISRSTCVTQPAPYGVVGAASSVASSNSSVKSSVSSSVVVSSSSSKISSVSSLSSSKISSSASSKSSSSFSKSSSSVASSSGLTAVQLTQKMGVGWNLGNTLEAIGGETAWGNPLATQQLINSVKAAGFKTIRIPVAFSRFSDANNFVIDAAWMSRVEQVVNYALNADMYVMINIHWDGGWMQPTYAQQTYVNNRLNIMWNQIATKFRDYDDRLLFAGTNEVMVDGDYGTPTLEYYTVQNSFNQTFVNSVRGTGGKNASRFLVVQGFNTNIDHTVNFAKIPTDTTTNHLLMEVHYYDPYNFTLNASSNITQWGKNATDPSKTETWANESYTDAQFQKMKTNFVDKGVGVILGEYAAMSRTNIPDHEQYRLYWDQYISESAIDHQLVPVYWDAGYTGNNGSGLFDRNTGAQVYPAIIQAIVNAGN